jgi:hypothetical protein
LLLFGLVEADFADEFTFFAPGDLFLEEESGFVEPLDLVSDGFVEEFLALFPVFSFSFLVLELFLTDDDFVLFSGFFTEVDVFGNEFDLLFLVGVSICFLLCEDDCFVCEVFALFDWLFSWGEFFTELFEVLDGLLLDEEFFSFDLFKDSFFGGDEDFSLFSVGLFFWGDDDLSDLSLSFF